MLSDQVVYLRKLEETDLERCWQWMQEPDIFITIGVLAPVTKTAQRRWFDELDRTQTKFVFAICLSEGNTHVGNVSIDLIETRHRHARLAIFLADPTMRGQGIGSRAMRLLMDYAFSFLNLHRLYCKTTAGNEAVIRFYQRLGFTVEGCLREHEFVDGRYVDKIMLGVLRPNPGVGSTGSAVLQEETTS